MKNLHTQKATAQCAFQTEGVVFFPENPTNKAFKSTFQENGTTSQFLKETV